MFSAVFRRRQEDSLLNIGLGFDKIESRGTILSDPLHTDWNEANIYRLTETASGLGFGGRTKFYASAMDTIFDSSIAWI